MIETCANLIFGKRILTILEKTFNEKLTAEMICQKLIQHSQGWKYGEQGYEALDGTKDCIATQYKLIIPTLFAYYKDHGKNIQDLEGLEGEKLQSFLNEAKITGTDLSYITPEVTDMLEAYQNCIEYCCADQQEDAFIELCRELDPKFDEKVLHPSQIIESPNSTDTKEQGCKGR